MNMDVSFYELCDQNPNGKLFRFNISFIVSLVCHLFGLDGYVFSIFIHFGLLRSDMKEKSKNKFLFAINNSLNNLHRLVGILSDS